MKQMKQMKKIISVCLLAILFALPSLAQDKPLKLGIEIEATPLLRKTSYAFLSGYTGLYAEWHITRRFSTKVGAGLNHVFFDYSRVSELYGIQAEKLYIERYWSVSLEPRYYLCPQSKAWGTVYAALPISLKTSPQLGYHRNFPALFVLPTLGYRYAINKHWACEASAGAGIVREMRWAKGTNLISRNRFEYNLQARIGYSF
jgi:hypothetical protein